MKLLIFTLALWSASSMAEIPEIRAFRVTCEELQSFVEQHGKVYVLKKHVLFFSKKLVAHTEIPTCGEDYVLRSLTFKTLTDRWCPVSHYCEYSPPYTGSSSSDSGYDGPIFSGGTSYDPPSSNDHGPRYDPPSSSDHGPRYDPPSSSDHGPRYCPSC